MNPYVAAVNQNVQNAVGHGLTASQLAEPLINNLAKIAWSTAKQHNLNLEDIVEIMRHNLDQRVTHYANQCRPR